MSTAAASKTATKKTAKPSVEHPPVAEMVQAAISSLKEKKGSSLAAIKKYITGNYKGIDLVRIAPFIRRYLKKAVTDGTLEQIKGSFRQAAKAKAPKEKKPAAKKETKTKKPAAKKSPKKAKAAKKPAAKKSLFKTPKKTAEKKAAKPKAVKKPAAKKATKPAAAKKATKK